MSPRFPFLLISIFISSVLFAQEQHDKDSLLLDQIQQMNPVVITGQYNPQSVDESVFEVQVLTQKEIKNMAGNTLDDVLNQTLNLTIIPNSGQGRAGIEQFGFGSEYIKILVDGIPVVGDQGFGNAIDISQINLDDIKQIEIVEGSMGVQYGANAVTGVINIITEKKSKHAWEITPFIQEESIGDEYSWFDQGQHLQSLSISHNFSDHWYASASYMHNDFQGYLGNKQGKYYFNPQDGNDNRRGFEWLPKEQNDVKALINYHHKDFRAFYKFEYFHEKTNKYAHDVFLNPNNATQTVNPTANDAIFRTDRIYNHLNLSGRLLQQMNYSISLSYQQQQRNKAAYTYHLKTGAKTHRKRFDYNTRKGYFSRGTLSNFLKNEGVDFELGYVVNIDEGSATGLSMQNVQTNTQTHQINTYSFFGSAEIEVAKRLSLRPGIRWINSNNFSDQYALSFSGKYRFKNGYRLRAILGSSPKIPNFEQLYFYMVDSNHDIRGNEALKPEKGRSVFLHLKKSFFLRDYTLIYKPKLSAWYLDVDDKIDLIIVNQSPLSYQYNNIDRYRTWGVALRNQFDYQRFSAGLGLAFSGESKILNSAQNYNDDYLYALQVNARLSYQIPEWNTHISAFYKYNGPEQLFVSSIDNNGNTQIHKEEQEAYSWLNASIRKSFYQNRFEITLGARNLLNVTQIKSYSSGSGHAAGSNSLLLGYGRSYFVKLLYRLNF